MDWKQQAEKMYYDGTQISDIAILLDKSRQAVSGHLKTCEGYLKEKQRRKQINQEKRKEYKKAYNRANMIPTEITAETLKREHDIAVAILSHEKY